MESGCGFSLDSNDQRQVMRHITVKLAELSGSWRGRKLSISTFCTFSIKVKDEL